MNYMVVLVLFILIMVPVFISMMFIPYWTRRTESFGVSIPEEIYQRPELKAMRKQYAFITGIISVLVMIFFLILGSSLGNEENTFSILFSIVLVIYIISSFLVYLKFHRQMKMRKAHERWGEQKSQQVVIDTRFRDQKLTYSNLWFICSFLISLATMIITFRLYDQIPERIPMQYSFEGEVTNWADKSYRTVLVMPIMQSYLTLLFLFINTMIAKAKQQVSAEKPEQSMRQNVIFRRRWSAFIVVTGTALTLLFSLIQLSFIYPVNQQVLVVVPILFGIGVTISTIVLSFTTGQGGSRVKTSIGNNRDVIDRDDDQHWKIGQFYYNKNDPALFLEKRFGIGWTVNLARPLAWIIFLVIILLAVGIPIVLGT
jgi:uncharacterized membrane protein